ncbi:MAG: molecular chaperone DnaJ [Gammaproteobacteria bacterium]|nr:molecular chaperone DnaJ [Gammaproteobacteria bacterium]
MHPILLLVALVAVLFLISWYKRVPKAKQRQFRMKALLIGGGIILFFALITGKLHPLFAALAALVPLAYRAIGLFQTFNTIRAFTNRMKAGASPGPTPGQTSEVETAFLRMRLDHDSGEMDGTVLQGRYEGCGLRGLGLQELLELMNECRSDRQSVAVLAAYLDRFHEGWRERQEPPPGQSSSDGMNEDEARAVLGVGPDATREEIVQAHRRLMQRLHPDRGGSDYLAAKLNAAKDLLLGA